MTACSIYRLQLPGGVAAFEYGVETRRQIRDQYFRGLFCDEGEYSSYGQLFFAPLADSLKLLIHLGEVYEQNGSDETRQHLFTMDAVSCIPISIWAIRLTSCFVHSSSRTFSSCTR